MTERELAVALDALVDRCDDTHGDWTDVLSRADVVLDPAVADGALAVVPRSRRRPSTRRIGLVAFAALLLGVVTLVATGFARNALSFLGRIDVDFRSSEPAPDVVRWRFEDLAIGSPPEFAPQAITSEARTVGTLLVNGKERTIWVAPTRRGGFCYEVENSLGGCPGDVPRGGPVPRATSRVVAGTAVSFDPRQGQASAVRVRGVEGLVHGDEVERLTIEFADGASEDVDFVYVSTPIDAGFFSYAVPLERQSGPGRPRRIVGRDGAGDVVASQRLHVPSAHPPITRQPRSPRDPSEPRHRARPSPLPSPPIQRGEAHGVAITAGKNGSVLFDLRGITRERRTLLEKGVSYLCFELVLRGGVLRDRTLGFSGNLQPTAGFRFNGIGTPLDGCYLTGLYGHRWPGKLDSHSVVEVAFTEDGRRFFHDRAAASDLALFARSRAMHRLRQQPPITADELRVQFGTRIATLASRAAIPPRGMIGYWVDGPNLLLRRVSASGRRLEVVIGPNGGITSENIRHLTRVE